MPPTQESALRKFRFSQKQIDNLPPNPPDAASREMEYSDTEVIGLRVLVSKNGRKTFATSFWASLTKEAWRSLSGQPSKTDDPREPPLLL